MVDAVDGSHIPSSKPMFGMVLSSSASSVSSTPSTLGKRPPAHRVVKRPNWIAILEADGYFNVELRKQIKQWKLRNTQLSYRIVTSFGGGYTYDSKNKYLMLDQIFGTDLGNVTWPVETNIRLCPAKDANILVMDVEGISKWSVRDMELERKAALLSLAMSDIIIFHFSPADLNNSVRKFMLPVAQVTHGLLRQGASQSKSRTLLLFVVHYIFDAPLSTEVLPVIIKSLEEAFFELKEKTNYNWRDAFEIVVVSPSDFNLQNEIAQLSPRFTKEKDEYYLFRPEYNKSISIDRLALSVEILCDISTEEGVTLPTHEELLIKLSQGSYNDDSDEVDMHGAQDLSLTIKQPVKEYADIGIQVISTDVDLRVDQNVSLLLLLGELRNRKTDDPIDEVVNLLTIDIFRKLLGTNDYANIASLIHDSDVGVFLDFVLCLLDNNYLPNLDLLDANRRARRLLLKLAAKKLVLPNSMFISHVRIDQSFVGWGGYADVYKGEFRGKPVAVKVLRTNSQSDVCREAVTWKSLSHKFILPFLGIYKEKAQLFLVSPFMKNGSLSAWRKKSEPSIGEVHKRLLEVAEGVQYIHSEGIVHGDIRGSNILLDSDFHAKIADFGLTRHLEGTATKSTSFSPNFAAPELFGTWDDDDDWSDSDDDGSIGVVRTHKSDVYAFGCLYYEIHFNVIPFEDTPYVQLMKQVTRYRKRPDRLGEPPLSDKAWKLIKRCWIHEASRRPTMEQVIESMVKWDIK